ncbi:MAG: histidine--tRNA ligase [Terriglobales bacterium]
MIHAIKGMRDILPPETALWRRFEAEAREVFRLYGFGEIRTPVLEPTELFSRAVGAETDIVGKEMFSFQDRDESWLSLRPEATASVVRAYVEHRLWERGGLTRLYYLGPMFRRERPQKGRYRQFSQIGAEALGGGEPVVDYQVLEMLDLLVARCGLKAELRLNSIGCPADRARYQEALRAAVAPRLSQMCADCQRRFQTNPLRILDCKVAADQPIIVALPTIEEFLDAPCREHFAGLRRLLEAGGIAYQLAPRLVRGLDYYNRTAFEFVHGALGAQNALLGGGRYDGLARALGAPASPPSIDQAIGFAIGEDRWVLAMQAAEGAAGAAPAALDLYVIPIGAAMAEAALAVARQARRAGLAAETGDGSRKLGKLLELAARSGARGAVLVGEAEQAKGMVVLRDLASGQQRELRPEELASGLAAAAPGAVAREAAL